MIEEDRRRRVLHNDPMYADAMILASDPEMSAFFEKEARSGVSAFLYPALIYINMN